MRDTEGFAVVAETKVTNGPVGGIAVSDDGRRLVVTNCGAESVSIIGTGARPVVSTVSGLPEPSAIAVGADRACVNIASPTYDAIAVLDLAAETVVAVHPVPFRVTDVAVSPSGKQVYCNAVEGGHADIAALDTSTGTGDTVEISAVPGTTTGSLRISPDGRQLFVAAHGHSSDQLVLIDTRQLRVTGSVEIGSPIRGIAVSPSGDTVYVASCSPDFGAVVDVIDAGSGTVAGTAKITGTGRFVTQLASSADGARAYLVDDHGVTVLSTSTLDVIGSIAIDGSPSCVVETAGGTCLCVADYAGMVTVLSVPSGSTRADDDVTARNEWARPGLRSLASAMA